MAEVSTSPASDEPQRPIFQQALDEYIASVPQNKHEKLNFIAFCRRMAEESPDTATPDRINEQIKAAEDKRKGKKRMDKLLRPIIRALKDFEQVIKNLVSTGPAPCALIWAALFFAVETVDKYFNFFETIQDQLSSLTAELNRLTLYEDLYISSITMRELLCKSYITIIRFWCRVKQECERSARRNILGQAFLSDTDKLTSLVNEMKEDAANVAKMAPIVENRLALNEREKADEERQAAGIERREARKEREEQSKFRDEQRELDLWHHICTWFGPESREANNANVSRHEGNMKNRVSGTCGWIITHAAYTSWRSSTTKPSILWICGPPGSGKSTLCSRVIEDLEHRHPDASLIYHFYEFDNKHTTISALRLLADRLFDAHWRKQHAVPEDFFLATQKRTCSLEDMKELIKILVRDPASNKIIFLIDGLDEEAGEDQRWTDACSILSFLVFLAEEFPDKVQLWCSSQNRPCIRKHLEKYPTIEIGELTNGDVTKYLEHQIPYLPVNEKDKKDKYLQDLLKRADGNFLCASLMARALREDANSLADIEDFLESKQLPSPLDAYYFRVFRRIPQQLRLLACKVFALIVFARRPLRTKELSEAVGILQSKDPRRLSYSDLPFRDKLEKVFAPLIEVRSPPIEAKFKGDHDWDESTCHLFHSTLRKFLGDHPGVLDGSCIKPSIMADACLLYLSQARYSRPLKKEEGTNRWLDGRNEPVDDHQFYVYCSKYWDKHLDDMVDWGESGKHPDASVGVNSIDKVRKRVTVFMVEWEESGKHPDASTGSTSIDKIRKRVTDFLSSGNFQTTLQAQSLWVDGQFDTFNVEDPELGIAFVRRTFPKWFLATKEGSFMSRCYHRFLCEWRHFLRMRNSAGRPYAGEVDRCWWAALGGQSFLSAMPSRYTNFTFSTGENPPKSKEEFSCEGINQLRNELKILRLSSVQHATLSFVCEHWMISRRDSSPILRRTQTIETEADTTHWYLYQQKTSDKEKTFTISKAPAAAFQCDCDILRIGAQIFTLNEDRDEYVSVGLLAEGNYPPYFEECTTEGNVLAIATRRIITTQNIYTSGLGDGRVATFGVNLTEMEKRFQRRPGDDTESDDEVTTDWSDESDEEDSEETSSCEDEAYETWSECSSKYSNEAAFEDDLATPWGGPDSDDNKPETYSDAEHESEVEQIDHDDDSDMLSNGGFGFGASGGTSSESNQYVPSGALDYGKLRGDDEDYRWGHDDDDAYEGFHNDSYARSSLRRKNKSPASDPNTPTAYLTIFDRNSYEVLFRFQRPLRFMLFSSPPVLHPSQSLVVWPLSGGNILFADFKAKTYFIRRLRPSTSYTRHLSMNCHFSPCGRFLHIASVEARCKPTPPSREAKSKAERPPLNLALLVATYRLCAEQPTRTPPALTHRVKVALGTEQRLSVFPLPYTLNWTPEELYLTFSDSILRVYRVPLFSSREVGEERAVLMPANTFFLPDTAKRREVYYFPGDPGLIIVGKEARKSGFKELMCLIERIPETPIGCYVNEHKDLGGWERSNNHLHIPEDLGIGKFDRLLEKFNPISLCSGAIHILRWRSHATQCYWRI